MITTKSTAAVSSREGSTVSDVATIDCSTPRSSSCVGSICTSRLNCAPPQFPNVVPTMKNVEHINPGEVQRLMGQRQCILVDVRGEDWASGIITGYVHEQAVNSGGSAPFSTSVPELVEKWKDKPLIVFTCQYSGHHEPQCANWYREKAPPHQRVAIMSMGFRSLEGLGLAVQETAMDMRARATDSASKHLGRMFVTNCLTTPTASSPAPTIAQRAKEGWCNRRPADNHPTMNRRASEATRTPPLLWS